MYDATPPLKVRIGAGVSTVVVIGLVGWALLMSLAFAHGQQRDDALSAVTVLPLETPPPPAVTPERKPSKEPEGEAAPPNIRSTPTEVVAPKAPILLIPPPIPAATVSGSGIDASAGEAEVPGPGQGAGGVGDGRGSGGFGDGTGGGLEDEIPPQRIRGRLGFSDAARIAGWENIIGREMTTRYIVGVDGRVTDCRATRSSGLPSLDAEICRLIEERFRYRPSRDARGRPIRSGVEMDHSWDQQR